VEVDGVRFSPTTGTLPTLAPNTTETIHFNLWAHSPITVIGNRELDYNLRDPEGLGSPHRLQIDPELLEFDGGYLDRMQIEDERMGFLTLPIFRAEL
jgi:hypothetical protein